MRAVPVRSAGRNGHGKHASSGPTVTVGVDTHLDQHEPPSSTRPDGCGTKAFAASTRGYVALVTWAEHFGPVERIGVEGTGSYGAGLARFVRAYGLQILEVDRPDRSTRRRHGKSDMELRGLTATG